MIPSTEDYDHIASRLAEIKRERLPVEPVVIEEEKKESEPDWTAGYGFSPTIIDFVI